MEVWSDVNEAQSCLTEHSKPKGKSGIYCDPILYTVASRVLNIGLDIISKLGRNRSMFCLLACKNVDVGQTQNTLESLHDVTPNEDKGSMV